MDQIQISARFPSIPAPALAEFKRLAAQALELTSGDPGVSQYDWFFNEDETVCVVRETYADSDAVLAHVAQLGDVLGNLVEVAGGCELEVYGNPSTELREATSDLSPSIFRYLQGK